MIAVIYYGTIILILIYLISVFLYTCALIVSALDGAPYVKIKKNVRQTVLDNAHISKKSHFIEIGSGLGELSMAVFKTYDCKVTGIEINPFLFIVSKVRSMFEKTNRIHFVRTNAIKYDYSPATHVYLFLLPPIIRKLTPTLKKTCSKGTMVISYGFCIPSFKPYLIQKIDLKPFPIYYYKL